MTVSFRKGLFALALACAAYLLAATAPWGLAEKGGAQNSEAQKKAPAAVSANSPTPADILRRADQLTNIRAVGSTPFHLKAHFVATGPIEFIGEGDYEETWLASDRWVEEIHFGPYHSIETQEGAKRSFEANQSYRPKRILQAVALLTHTNQHPEMKPAFGLNDPSSGWGTKTDPTSGIIQLLPPSGVPLSFNPDGTPAQDGQYAWFGYAEFSGKRVARMLQENSPMAVPLLKINITQLDALPLLTSLPDVSVPDAVVGGDPGLLLVDKDVTPPKLVYAPDPEFPKAARKKRLAGMVVVNFMVDTNGMPRDIEVISDTDPMFIPAAVKAVSGYKFEPARRNGMPVQVQVNVQVNFRLY
jgi:TonB family protein